MKPLFASLLLLSLSGCLSTSPEVQVPTIWSDLQAALSDDKLVLRYRMYEAACGVLDLSKAGSYDVPTEQNTLLYERFVRVSADEPAGVGVPLEIDYVSVVKHGRQVLIVDTAGRELHPTHDHIALLNHQRSADYFGYVFLRRDRPSVIFFVKPQVFSSKTKVAIPVPAGWKD